MTESGKNSLRLTVHTGKPYDVVICDGQPEMLANELQKIKKNCKILIISDSNVAELYLKKVTDVLSSGGYSVCDFVFPAGEKSKNIETFSRAAEAAAGNGITRGDVILSLGGGVPGDLGGFVAATYMRGVTFVQVPTTLLADIDSSVGGKTAIDTPFGKNLIGAFYQPSLTFIDVGFLSTLPNSEMKNGLGEGVKYAILIGGEVCSLVRSGIDKDLLHFVYLCVKYKRDIVERDEYEHSERKLLNLGHTVAHAIEKLSGYTVPHGNAVAQGIRKMAKSQLGSKEIDTSTFAAIEDLLTSCELNGNTDYTAEELVNCIKNDKKIKENGQIDLVKIKSIGSCYIQSKPVSDLSEYFK